MSLPWEALPSTGWKSLAAVGAAAGLASLATVAGLEYATRLSRQRKSDSGAPSRSLAGEGVIFLPGLSNRRNTCFFNALLQALASCPILISELETLIQKLRAQKPPSISLLASEKLLALLSELSNPRPNPTVLSTRPLLEELHRCCGAIFNEFGDQQDSLEALTLMRSAVVKELVCAVLTWHRQSQGLPSLLTDLEQATEPSQRSFPRALSDSARCVDSDAALWPCDGIIISFTACGRCGFQFMCDTQPCHYFSLPHTGTSFHPLLGPPSLTSLLHKFTAPERIDDVICPACSHKSAQALLSQVLASALVKKSRASIVRDKVLAAVSRRQQEASEGRQDQSGDARCRPGIAGSRNQDKQLSDSGADVSAVRRPQENGAAEGPAPQFSGDAGKLPGSSTAGEQSAGLPCDGVEAREPERSKGKSWKGDGKGGTEGEKVLEDLNSAVKQLQVVISRVQTVMEMVASCKIPGECDCQHRFDECLSESSKASPEGGAKDPLPQKPRQNPGKSLWPVSRGLAIRRTVIGRIPQVVCIHMSRLTMDAAGNRRKLQGHVSFPLSLSLEPHLYSHLVKEVSPREHVHVTEGASSNIANTPDLREHPRTEESVPGEARGSTSSSGGASREDAREGTNLSLSETEGEGSSRQVPDSETEEVNSQEQLDAAKHKDCCHHEMAGQEPRGEPPSHDAQGFAADVSGSRAKGREQRAVSKTGAVQDQVRRFGWVWRQAAASYGNADSGLGSGRGEDQAMRIRAVVVHHGAADSGHYSVYRRYQRRNAECGKDDRGDDTDGAGLRRSVEKWFLISDENVSEVDVAEVLKAQATVLFYSRH